MSEAPNESATGGEQIVASDRRLATIRKPRISGRGPHSLEYCLYCYAPMATTVGASQRCARCGKVHLRRDQVSHWSREPKLIAIEWAIKSVIVVGLIVYLGITTTNYQLGPVSTFFIGPLLMLGGVLWWTTGLITRRPRYFSARVLWSTTILMLVFGTPLLLFVMDIVARRESFDSDYWQAYMVLASPALPMLIIAALLHFFSARFAAFKKRRVAGGVR